MKHNALVKKNQTVIKDIEFYNDLECKKKKKKKDLDEALRLSIM